MVCYHQNLIMRTLGLTISPFFMITNLGYLGEEKSPSQTNYQLIKIYEVKTKIIKTCKISIGNSVSHETYNISYISQKYMKTYKPIIYMIQKKDMTMICM